MIASWLQRKIKNKYIHTFFDVLSVLDIPRVRFFLFLLIVGGSISAALELMGLVIIYPLLRSIINYQDILRYHHWFAHLVHFLPFPAYISTVIIMSCIVFGIIFAKVLYQILFFNWRESVFCQYEVKITLRLVRYFLSTPYHQSLKLGHIHMMQVMQYTKPAISFLSCCVDIVINMLILVIFSGFFMKTHPWLVSFIIIWFGGFIFSLQRLLRRKIYQMGSQKTSYDKNLNQYLVSIFSMLKEIRILGGARTFQEEYEDNTKGVMAIFHKMKVYSYAPHVMVELMALLGILIVLITLMFVAHYDASFLVGFIAVLTMLFIRLGFLFAGTQRAFHAIDLSYESVLLWLKSAQDMRAWEKISSSQEKNVPHIPFEKSFGCQNLSFTYPGSNTPVLKNISVTFYKGKKYGIVGRSGAGKTSFVDVMMGLLVATKGSFFVDDQDVGEDLLLGWRRYLSFVPQKVHMLPASLRENIAFGVETKDIDDDKVKEALQKVQLGDLLLSLPEGLDTVFGTGGQHLSGGQQQRIALARSFYHEKDVIFLDEATSALDVITEADVMSYIHTIKEKTLLIVAHRLSTLKECDEILYFDQGELKGTGTFQSLSEEFSDFKDMVAKSSF